LVSAPILILDVETYDHLSHTFISSAGRNPAFSGTPTPLHRSGSEGMATSARPYRGSLVGESRKPTFAGFAALV